MALFLTFTCLYAENPALQPISKDGKTYNPQMWNEIDSLKVSNNEDIVTMDIAMEDSSIISMKMDDYIIDNGYTVPLVIINTHEPMDQIPDRINYQSAKIEIKGLSGYEDFEGEVHIRGRGNTSWTISDKKPYRLKFEKKQQLCGLKKAKNYVLTANWTDFSLMQNPIASYLAKFFNLPYTHTMVPVDVILNGTYRGSYLLTNKPGINAGSVDIDENSSVMWEIDKNYDEELKFKSPIYDLPVMLADPDMDSIGFNYWKHDFIKMEEAVRDGRPADVIDIDEYARYRCVYDILLNSDLYLPKSLKMFKTYRGKYIFGPVWDFDVAMGFNWDEQTAYDFNAVDKNLGKCLLMHYIETDPEVRTLIRKYMNEFLHHEEEFWDFINNLEDDMYTSGLRNSVRWSSLDSWEESVATMKKWMAARMEYLKSVYLE